MLELESLLINEEDIKEKTEKAEKKEKKEKKKKRKEVVGNITLK